MRVRGPLVALGVAAAAGCAPGANTGGEPLSPGAEASRELLGQLLNTDNGLELRRWAVADDPQRIGAALLRYQDSPAPAPRTAEALQRSGLRLVRVPTDQLGSLLAEMGVTPLEVAAWHGQVTQWREILEQPVPEGGAVVAVGGRVQRLAPGRLRLMARAWTIAMEDGPYLYLELLPELTRPQAPSFYQLLGGRDLEGEVFKGLLVQVKLAPGDACVLTGESPAAPWPDDGAAPSPAPAVGPEAAAPDTLGEFLFAGRGQPPLRTLLVFVPRIPDRVEAAWVARPGPGGEPAGDRGADLADSR